MKSRIWGTQPVIHCHVNTRSLCSSALCRSVCPHLLLCRALCVHVLVFAPGSGHLKSLVREVDVTAHWAPWKSLWPASDVQPGEPRGPVNRRACLSLRVRWGHFEILRLLPLNLYFVSEICWGSEHASEGRDPHKEACPPGHHARRILAGCQSTGVQQDEKRGQGSRATPAAEKVGELTTGVPRFPFEPAWLPIEKGATVF